MENGRFSPYRPALWLPGGHVQTIAAARLALRRPVAYVRSRWETADQDFIDVDCSPHPVADEAPLLVLFHGLEGSSQSHYAAAFMKACRKAGWLGVVPHFRGCSGEPNRLPRAYHSGDSAEIDWILRRLRLEHPGRAVYAVGVSLGGNALLKWLGESGAAAGELVDKAAAISAPIDLEASAYNLSRGFNMRYTRFFLNSLIPKMLEKIARFPGLADPNAVRRCKDFFDFDRVVTAPLHGFANAHDYWRKSASRPFLKSIAVPTLIVNAKNDPFLPGHFLPAARDVSPAVELLYPQQGGHAAFPTRSRWPFGQDWLPRRCFEFFGVLDE
ncbi:MAG: YheT family hydrolase [Burkholderiaceae bacterium]